VTRRHTSGFGILGMSGDPTPGDPDQIDRLARDYEEIRDDAQTALRVLGRGGSLSQARGDSMTKLRGMLDSLPGKLQRTVTSFDTAAQAYRTYARVLRDQQTRIDTAMDQAAAVSSIARTTANIAEATDSADIQATAAGSLVLGSETSQTLQANAVYTVFLLGDYAPASTPPVTYVKRLDRAPSAQVAASSASVAASASSGS